eukprot:TRINITY_DN23956_c0_g1_i1.p1 TRINITY_DN23956_c0_g1~~TRINITY_DN23956_c0_g1_i1.p1  ORF type:complete len:358 (+),score=66.38 TRINITY_DN23956_c0_g1_i1:54-1076(+)
MELDNPARVLAGLFAAVVMVVGVFGLRKGLVVTGCGYGALLGWMLWVGVEESRRFFVGLDPELGRGFVERDYASMCDVSYGSVWESLDIFLLAHSVGYWAKMLILRDATTTLLISILFEHLEVTFQHTLPNFLECWWDHVFLDILLCNALGMLLGYVTLKAFKMELYPWWESSISSYSPRRFLQAMLGLAIMMVSELCLFFLKYALHHPPSHPFTLTRMAFWAWASGISYMDYHRYVSAGPKGSFPPLVAFCIVLCTLEVALVFRFLPLTLPPALITTPWLATLLLLALFIPIHYTLRLRPLSLIPLHASIAVLTLSFIAALPDVDLFGKDHISHLLHFY